MNQPKQTISKTENINDNVKHIVAAADCHSIYAENFDTKENAYLEGVKYGAHVALTYASQHSYSEQEQWVSVKDGLPTDGQFYLTCYKSNDYYRCETGQIYTRKDGSKCFVDDNESAINATHWMPLPAPPKQ